MIDATMSLIDIALRYGSPQLMRTLRLIKATFPDITDEQFRVLADEYSDRCIPPWTPKELAHAIENIYKKPSYARTDRPREHKPTKFVTNYRTESTGEGTDAKVFRIGLSQGNIKGQIQECVGNWPKSAGGVLFAEGQDHQPLFLETPTETFAWLAEKIGGDTGDNAINWADRGDSMVSKAQFHASLLQTVDQYETVESAPHFPPMDGSYYLHQPIDIGDGKAISQLLDFFAPCTPVDRQLLLAFIASLVWGGPPGKRPAWLFTGPDSDPHGGRGVGKTTAVEKLAGLVGGSIGITDAANAKAEEIDRRLLSLEGRKRRVLLIDNLKALRFSWQYVESIITGSVISGRQMFVGEGRRPNNITIAITANGASLSRDMAQRCFVIKLARPTYSAGDWDAAISSFIEGCRLDILADLRAFFDGAAKPIKTPGRWGPWEQAILARLDDPNEAQRVLAERAAACDEDEEELAIVRDEIRAEIRSRFHDPDRIRAKIAARALADIVNRATGEKRAVPRATAYARQLGIREMCGHSRRGGRFYYWTGKDSDPSDKIALVVSSVSGTPLGGEDDAGDA